MGMILPRNSLVKGKTTVSITCISYTVTGSIKDCCVMTQYYWDIAKKKIVCLERQAQLVIFWFVNNTRLQAIKSIQSVIDQFNFINYYRTFLWDFEEFYDEQSLLMSLQIILDPDDPVIY